MSFSLVLSLLLLFFLFIVFKSLSFPNKDYITRKAEKSDETHWRSAREGKQTLSRSQSEAVPFKCQSSLATAKAGTAA